MVALLFRLCLAALAMGPALALDVVLSRSGSGVVIGTTPATQVTITITFSAAVADFLEGDLGVAGGGALGSISGTGTTYTAIWTPPASATGQVVFTVDAAAASDGVAGNNAATPLTIDFDTLAPGLVVTAPAVASITVGSVPVTVEGTIDDAAAIVEIREEDADPVTLSGLSWQTNLSLTDGVHALSIVATDPNGNATTVPRSVTVDTVGPTVTWGTAGPLHVRSGVNAEILVNYADATTGVSNISLDYPDVTLTTSLVGVLVAVDGSGTASRTLTVSGLSGDGTTVEVGIAAQTAIDGINNLATAPVGTVTIIVDDTDPTMTPLVASTATTSAATFPLVLAFSEALAQAPTLTLQNASVVGSAVASVGSTVWTFTLDPLATGAVRLSRVQATDLAGNPLDLTDTVLLMTVVDAVVVGGTVTLPPGLTPGGRGCGVGAAGGLLIGALLVVAGAWRRRRSDP